MVFKPSYFKIWRISFNCFSNIYPFINFLEKYKIDKKTFLQKSITIIMITLVIFLARNVKRIHKEFKYYGYNPLKNLTINLLEAIKIFILDTII